MNKRVFPLIAALLLASTALVVPSVASASNCITPTLAASTETGTTTPASLHFASVSNVGPNNCTYQNLRITGLTRGTTTSCDPYLLVNLGDSGTLDTGNHYNYSTFWEGGGAGGFGAWGYHQATMQFGQIPCSTRPTGAAGTFNILIYNAFGTTYFKPVIATMTNGFDANSRAGTESWGASGLWESTGAVSDVQISLSTGSMEQHTLVTLWLE